MIYQYEAADRSGTIVQGELDAPSQKEAVGELNRRRLIVTNLEVLKSGSTLVKAGKKATKQDLLMSLHEMVTLLESGVNIADTIESQTMANYPRDLSSSYQTMAKEVRKGNSFSKSLESAELYLPEYIYYLAEAGELTGNLAGSLRQGVEQFEYEQKLSHEFRSALIYPLILLLSGVGAVLMIFIFVIPNFLPMLEKAQDLPLLSRLVFGAGLMFNEHAFWILCIVALSLCGCVWASTAKKSRQKILDIFAGLPIVGIWITETYTARWSSAMAALLASRADLLHALDLSEQAVRSTRRKALLKLVSSDVRAGEALADSLERAEVLTATGYNLIRAGEKTGKLPGMMKSVARLYDEGARNRMQRVLALIEPIAILLIGGFIGTIIIGVILAITSVNSVSF